VHLELVGWSKWLALSRGLYIRLSCIKSATAGAPDLPKFRWRDLRVGGTGVPGTLAMGRFWMGSPHRWVFLDLRRSSNEVLVLELQNYPYDSRDGRGRRRCGSARDTPRGERGATRRGMTPRPEGASIHRHRDEARSFGGSGGWSGRLSRHPLRRCQQWITVKVPTL
jgi:hypothetical protein